MAKSLTGSHSWTKPLTGTALVLALEFSPAAFGQDRDWGRYWNQERGLYTMLQPGAVIAIRTQDPIDVERTDNRVFIATVDQDVRGDNGRLAIPRGSRAELIVRVARDNDLILDLESVVVNGQRYALKTDSSRVESERDYSVVGSILGAISGGQGQGRSVRLPRGSVVSFRLERPLEIGVVDRGVDRGGYHYHDYYGNPSRR